MFMSMLMVAAAAAIVMLVAVLMVMVVMVMMAVTVIMVMTVASTATRMVMVMMVMRLGRSRDGGWHIGFALRLEGGFDPDDFYALRAQLGLCRFIPWKTNFIAQDFDFFAKRT